MQTISRGARAIFFINQRIVLYRSYSSDLKNVRVRFAPSPTGRLHSKYLISKINLIGFLFLIKQVICILVAYGQLSTIISLQKQMMANLSFALKILIRRDLFGEQLRIFSKIQVKNCPQSFYILYNVISFPEWAGIVPDESVFHGGNHGPYVQSKRLAIYNDEVKKLLDSGSAYHCFCTERRLELVRKQAIRLQQKLGYDNKCRHLTAEQVEQKLSNKVSSCVR